MGGLENLSKSQGISPEHPAQGLTKSQSANFDSGQPQQNSLVLILSTTHCISCTSATWGANFDWSKFATPSHNDTENSLRISSKSHVLMSQW